MIAPLPSGVLPPAGALATGPGFSGLATGSGFSGSATGSGFSGSATGSGFSGVACSQILSSAKSQGKGAAGVDGQSVERFAAGAELYLSELHESLKSGSYRPSPVKRVDIPKGPGQTRPLGIPSVKDRIAQTALKMRLNRSLRRRFGKAATASVPAAVARMR